MQNSWIPNSYRVNKCNEAAGGGQSTLTPPDKANAIAKKVVKIASKADEHAIKSHNIISHKPHVELQVSEAQNEKTEQKKQIIEKQPSIKELSHGSIDNY